MGYEEDEHLQLKEHLAEAQAEIGYEQNQKAHWLNETLVAREEIAQLRQQVRQLQLLMLSSPEAIGLLGVSWSEADALSQTARDEAERMIRAARTEAS